jgi:hypothetical protein
MTARVAVDTDVTSFLFKGDSRAAAYVSDLTGKLIISVRSET